MSRKTHAPDTRRAARETECYCGGGQAHPWKPNGGGNRILAIAAGLAGAVVWLMRAG